MNIQTLLSKLSDIGVQVREIGLSQSQRLFILSCTLPEFPFGGREHAWYPLLVKMDQDEVDRDEVEAILRHLWHAEQDFFPDDPEEESTGAAG